MKNLFYLILAISFFSCGRNEKPVTQNKEPVKDTAKNTKQIQTVQDTNKEIYGFYVGEFVAVKFDETKSYVYMNKVTVSLDSIRREIFYGHSVVAGNSRPFKGTYHLSGTNYLVEAVEPGDDKYDGKFSFSVNPDMQTITGNWYAYKSDVYVTERKYELEKRDFNYDSNLKLPEYIVGKNLYGENQKYFYTDGEFGEYLTDDVLKVNASSKLLNKNDIENMHRGDLEIIRNSIYARHGYSFKNRRMRFVFDGYVEWYMPVSTDVTKQLTEIELKNIDLLKRYEQHAEKYYDSFGR